VGTSGAPQQLVTPAKAGIQYAAAYRSITGVSGILGHPLEPVIGLAEGETRWRMTQWWFLYLRTLKNSFSSVAASVSPTAE
jgi:hypothetical protein